MGTERTAWHPVFTALLEQFRPRWVKVTAEVSLAREPLRVDDVIELRAEIPRDPSDHGGTLRGLWRSLRRVGLLEVKSLTRPLRRGDLARLLAYGYLWLVPRLRRRARSFAEEPAKAVEPEVVGTSEGESVSDDEASLRPEDLTLLLAVPSLTKVLHEELEAFGWRLPSSTDGYHVMAAGPLTLVVLDLTHIAEAEDDDRLRYFGTEALRTLEGHLWVRQTTWSGRVPMIELKSLEGYDEMLKKIVEGLPPEVRVSGLRPAERLAGLRAGDEAMRELVEGLSPEVRVSGLSPAERLAGLGPAEVLLTLPAEVLRGLSEEYLKTLPAELQARVRARREGAP
ncbi:MAG: hypothetical protein HY909_18225 [Deltaproteobacteria bacterium]|nr:hypothetical protein [Deltaproteobacteria bacterium]